MKSIAIDMTGRRFGRLVAIGRAPTTKGKRAWWLFQCDCGNRVVSMGVQVRKGLRTSCGCWKREQAGDRLRTHGLSATRAHKSWCDAKMRCYNPKDPGYIRYGARGIKMADEWRNDFAKFYAELGDCPPGYTLERIDNSKDYAPGNCRWATRLEQAQNTRNVKTITMNGRTLSLSAWERELGFNPGTVKARIRNGWSHLKALTAPVRVR